MVGVGLLSSTMFKKYVARMMILSSNKYVYVEREKEMNAIVRSYMWHWGIAISWV